MPETFLRIKKVIISDDATQSRIITSDHDTLDGVTGFTITQTVGQLPKLIVEIDLKDVDIERI